MQATKCTKLWRSSNGQLPTECYCNNFLQSKWYLKATVQNTLLPYTVQSVMVSISDLCLKTYSIIANVNIFIQYPFFFHIHPQILRQMQLVLNTTAGSTFGQSKQIHILASASVNLKSVFNLRDVINTYKKVLNC